MARVKSIEDILPKQEARKAGFSPECHGYQNFCINYIDRKINEYYQGTGIQPPALSTIKTWFYKDNIPDWAVVMFKKTLLV
ncbi:MAG: hypothetical protein RLZZ184_98 [Cyanobacteriota bacterium]|jgi:hypothetical protein